MNMTEKKELVLESEYRLASRFAQRIILKPPLSIWMILIPVIFLFYFYALTRYKNARQDFVQNYVKTRKLILDATAKYLEGGVEPDFAELAELENVSEEAIPPFQKWARMLFEHFDRLLTADGESQAELVRHCYGNAKNYQATLSQINAAEICFYQALRKKLESDVSEAGATIKTMENNLKSVRSEEPDIIFGPAV